MYGISYKNEIKYKCNLKFSGIVLWPTGIHYNFTTRVGIWEQKGASAMVAKLTNWNVGFVIQLSAEAQGVAVD